MLSTAVLTAVLGFLDDVTMFVAAFTVLGALQSYARVPVVALVADVVDETNRGRAVALHQMAGDLGGIIGPVVAGVLASGAGFGAAFAVMAVPAALVALPAAWARVPRRRSAGTGLPLPEQP